jgi:hypothetical protein
LPNSFHGDTEKQVMQIDRIVVVAQAFYYVVTGLWPLVSYATFEAVTGPKTDRWLVHTIGLLLVAIGAALFAGARRTAPGVETLVLAACCASAFIAIEVFYVLNGVIAPVYLGDAIVQLCMLLAYGWSFATRRKNTRLW